MKSAYDIARESLEKRSREQLQAMRRSVQLDEVGMQAVADILAERGTEPSLKTIDLLLAERQPSKFNGIRIISVCIFILIIWAVLKLVTLGSDEHSHLPSLPLEFSSEDMDLIEELIAQGELINDPSLTSTERIEVHIRVRDSLIQTRETLPQMAAEGALRWDDIDVSFSQQDFIRSYTLIKEADTVNDGGVKLKTFTQQHYCDGVLDEEVLVNGFSVLYRFQDLSGVLIKEIDSKEINCRTSTSLDA